MTKALKAAQAARKAKQEKGETIARMSPIEKAKTNPKSRKLAVNAMCYQCQGSGYDPGVVEAIRTCPCMDTCPLWPVRPYQVKE